MKLSLASLKGAMNFGFGVYWPMACQLALSLKLKQSGHARQQVGGCAAIYILPYSDVGIRTGHGDGTGEHSDRLNVDKGYYMRVAQDAVETGGGRVREGGSNAVLSLVFSEGFGGSVTRERSISRVRRMGRDERKEDWGLRVLRKRRAGVLAPFGGLVRVDDGDVEVHELWILVSLSMGALGDR